MQKDSQTVAKLQHKLFIGLSMFIVTLHLYQNSANFQLAEIWVSGPPLSRWGTRVIVKIRFQQYISSRYSF